MGLSQTLFCRGGGPRIPTDPHAGGNCIFKALINPKKGNPLNEFYEQP